MPTKNENTDIIQNSLAAKGEIKEPQKSSVNNQNFQLTSDEVNQSQGITDTYAEMSNIDLLQAQKTLECVKNYYMRK